ncbi:MAG: type II secretion system protein GspN [Candidatus Binataceae bacterium]
MAESSGARSRQGLLSGHRMIAAYAVFGVILFVMFLVASFPYGQTLSSLLAPFRLKVAYRGQSLSLPVGAHLHDAKLISLATPDGETIVQSPDVRLAPTLGSLFFGRPALSIRAALYGGEVSATIHRTGRIVNVNFDLSTLNLADNPQLRGLGAVVDGLVSGQGIAQLAGPALPDNSGAFALMATGVTIQIGPGYPAVHFGTVTGKFRLNDGTLQIDQLEAHGGDADMKLDGAVQVEPDVRESAIDARLYLRPTAEGRHRLGFLFGFLPHPPGARPYHLRGPLIAPSIS